MNDDAPDDDIGEEHLDIWTYQALEKMKLYHPEELDAFLQQYKYIVADEAHYFMFDAQFNHDTVVSYDALKALWDQKIVIYMSATADYMFRQLENMNVVEAEQKYNVDKDTGYVDKVMVYWNDDQLACWLDCIPEGEKALVFMKSTDAVKKWRNKYGDMAVGYCSSNNAKTKKADNLYLHGQFYGATHNYTGVEGADDEAVRNRIEAQTAQFFRQTLLWGDAVNSGVEIKENIPLLYALGVKTSGCMRGDFCLYAALARLVFPATKCYTRSMF